VADKQSPAADPTSPDSAVDADPTALDDAALPDPSVGLDTPVLPKAVMPREVWVLVAAAFIVAVGFGLVAPALPTFASSFGVNATAVSVVISAFAFTRLIFAPLGGRLLKVMSERPVYLAGLAIVALSSVGVAYSGSYTWLLITRGLGGIGSTLFTISSFALLVRVTPAPLRGRASAVYSSGFLIGTITGPLFGGLLINFSIRAPFLAYAALLGVAIIVVQVLLGRGQLAPRPVTGKAGEMTLRQAVANPTYRAALTSNFAVGWAVFGVRVALLPLFVVQILAADKSMSGVALTVFAVGNAAVLPFAGRWADQYGRRVGVLAGLAISAAATGWIGITGSLWELLLACLIGGLGSGLITPGQQAAVADVVGEKGAGPVLAAFQMAGDIGAVLGPIVAGVLVDHSGFGLAFGVTAVVVAISTVPWLIAPESKATEPRVRRSGRIRPRARSGK